MVGAEAAVDPAIDRTVKVRTQVLQQSDYPL